jgi:uncharacterized protein (TIGR03032 family)
MKKHNSAVSVLVTFCNQELTPDLAAAVVDLSGEGFAWLRPTCSVSRGATGLALYANQCLIASQDERLHVFDVLDNGLQPRGVLELDGAQDVHGICLRETDRTLLVASTGTDSIIAYRLDLDSLRVEESWTFWTMAEEPGRDVLHVNDVAEHDGHVMISMFGVRQGTDWRDASQGCVMDVSTGEMLLGELRQPHSLVSHEESLYVLESGRGLLHRLGPNGEVRTYGPLPLYARGLAVDGSLALVGSSVWRTISRLRGEPVEHENRTEESGRCVLSIVDLDSGEVRFGRLLTPFGHEVFDLMMLGTGVRPVATRDPLVDRVVALEDVGRTFQEKVRSLSSLAEDQAEAIERLNEGAWIREDELSRLREEAVRREADLTRLREEADRRERELLTILRSRSFRVASLLQRGVRGLRRLASRWPIFGFLRRLPRVRPDGGGDRGE